MRSGECETGLPRCCLHKTYRAQKSTERAKSCRKFHICGSLAGAMFHNAFPRAVCFISAMHHAVVGVSAGMRLTGHLV